jgi:hypothetical protein
MAPTKAKPKTKTKPKTPTRTKTDWRKRFDTAKAPHVVTLSSDFAGVKAGCTMLISSPGAIANYIAAIPVRERRTIARLRSDLAKRTKADSMCPVTTAIFLRVVAEVALADMANGVDQSQVVPFWRVITAKDKVAAKLSCGAEGVEHLARLEGA